METEIFEPNKRSVNVGIIAGTVIVFFVMLFWEKSITKGDFYGNTTLFFLEHGALYGPAVKDGEWYRLLTYLFLHSGMEHLINNMLILYFIGNALERYLGRGRFLLLYLASGIFAALGSVFWNTSYPVCIGASGAVFGVCGGLAYLVLIHRGNLQGLTKKRMLIFLLLSVYGGFVTQGVDNAAHVAGLLSGFLLAAVLYRKPREDVFGENNEE